MGVQCVRILLIVMTRADYHDRTEYATYSSFIAEVKYMTLQVQLTDADDTHDLGLSSEEAARLQGFLDGSEVKLQ